MDPLLLATLEHLEDHLIRIDADIAKINAKVNYATGFAAVAGILIGGILTVAFR